MHAFRDYIQYLIDKYIGTIFFYIKEGCYCYCIKQSYGVMPSNKAI